MKVEILSDRPASDNLAAEDPSVACAFAQTTVMSNGDVACLYRIGRTKHSFDGVLAMQTSSDGGVTWSKPQIILDRLGAPAPMSVLSQGVSTTPSGALLATFTLVDASRPDLYVFSEEGFKLREQTCAIRSEDGGKTWAEPVEIRAAFPKAGITTKPVALADGEVLVPLEIKTGFGPQGTAAIFSSDDGRTFERPVILAADPLGKLNLCDARFAVLRDGRLLMLLWTFKQDNSETIDVHRSFSSDGGKTWSVCEPIGMLGGVTVPLTLSSAVVLAVSQFRQPPEGLRLWLSRDNGVSWAPDDSIQMWDARESRVLGAAAEGLLKRDQGTDVWQVLKEWTFGTQDLVLLEDGTVLMTYYATLDEILHIRACRFRVCDI